MERHFNHCFLPKIMCELLNLTNLATFEKFHYSILSKILFDQALINAFFGLILTSYLGLEPLFRVFLDHLNFSACNSILKRSKYGNLYWIAGLLAIDEDYESIIHLLLDSGAVDVNSMTRSYRDARRKVTTLSASRFNWIFGWILHRSEQSIDSKDNDGRTPLSWAAVYGDGKIVRMFLQRDDVDVNCKDNEGRTPLSWALFAESLRVIEKFLERHGVDVNSKDTEGRTPLAWAVVHGNSDIVKMFLKRDNVDVNCIDIAGKTPLFYAISSGHESITSVLKTRGAEYVATKRVFLPLRNRRIHNKGRPCLALGEISTAQSVFLVLVI